MKFLAPYIFQEVWIRHWGIKSRTLVTFRRTGIKIKVKVAVMLWWTFHIRQYRIIQRSQEMFEKLFGNVNEYIVSKFEAWYREYFCLQHSAFYVFAQAWNMQVCVHAVTLPCLCSCTYVLPLIMIYFPPNPVKYRCKAFSRVQIEIAPWQHGFPMTVSEEARQFDKTNLYISRRDKHRKNWAVHYALLERKLPQRNMPV